ncbi:MAG: homoserine dehydrogenase [Thiotrichales bacterium]|nr:homoserine dehydrogenase [Thiotrichales bacterium]
MKTFKIGLLGLGTVGGGTVRILQETRDEIERRIGHRIEIELIAVRDLQRARLVDTDGIHLTDDPFAVVNHPDIDIVVELMGGTTLAKELLLRAIENGKQIVTANKALLAEQGNVLFALAEKNQVNIRYEAAVAGGIPIIKVLREGLAANQIEWLAGIINGTGNYILTEMAKPEADFAQVLKTAQALGYAEADPTFDVEGIDAAHKLTILASIAFGIELQFDKVYTEGITRVTAEDMEFARLFDYKIKHLGFAGRTSDGFSLRVHPALVKKEVLIANVDGVMNAVMVKGNHVGPTMYYGPGAGAGPTASSVVADIIDVIRAATQEPTERVPALGFQANRLTQAPVEPIDAIESAYYLRCYVQDHAGVLAQISGAFADLGINIEQLHQVPNAEKPQDATLVIFTEKVSERKINQALVALQALTAVDSMIQRIRIADLG